MFALEAFWKGMIIVVLPCILCKVYAGFFLPPLDRYVVGWAMVGRGEFGFLVSATALETVVDGQYYANGEEKMLMTDETYAIVLWALLLSTILAPIAFAEALKRRVTKPGGLLVTDFDLHLKNCATQQGVIVHNVTSTLHRLGIDVLGAHVEKSTEVKGVDTKVFHCRAHGDGLDRTALEEACLEVREVSDDFNTAINVVSHFVPRHNEIPNLLEISIKGGTHAATFPKIVATLLALKLDVVRIHMENHLGVEVETLYAQDIGSMFEHSDMDIDEWCRHVEAEVAVVLRRDGKHAQVVCELAFDEETAKGGMTSDEDDENEEDLPDTAMVEGKEILEIRVKGQHNPQTTQAIIEQLDSSGMEVTLVHMGSIKHSHLDKAIFHVRTKESKPLTPVLVTQLKHKVMEAYKELKKDVMVSAHVMKRSGSTGNLVELCRVDSPAPTPTPPSEAGSRGPPLSMHRMLLSRPDSRTSPPPLRFQPHTPPHTPNCRRYILSLRLFLPLPMQS
eukprot:GCRY01003937.1.p1 GENE.GCRY01003937.1~~GCRY01003937.1.p1  ORF type:complete len:505 (+),score=169.80 GCRY01003937.1:94-1608(+)